MASVTAFDPHETIHEYFTHKKELRSGKDSAVTSLVRLWDERGIMEFAGSSIVTGTFVGINAIKVFYLNCLNTCCVPLRLEGASSVTGKLLAGDVSLAKVETLVDRTRTLQIDEEWTSGIVIQRTAVRWTTTIETNDHRGFYITGSHTFIFRNGKISQLMIRLSSEPKRALALNLSTLSRRDVDSMIRAAWIAA